VAGKAKKEGSKKKKAGEGGGHDTRQARKAKAKSKVKQKKSRGTKKKPPMKPVKNNSEKPRGESQKRAIVRGKN